MISKYFTGFILPNSYLYVNSNQCCLVGYQITLWISHHATCGHNLCLNPTFRSSLLTEEMYSAMYCLCYVESILNIHVYRIAISIVSWGFDGFCRRNFHVSFTEWWLLTVPYLINKSMCHSYSIYIIDKKYSGIVVPTMKTVKKSNGFSLDIYCFHRLLHRSYCVSNNNLFTPRLYLQIYHNNRITNFRVITGIVAQIIITVPN